ncbi:MAG: cytochrome B [Saprospiraceae bacterium]|jgi:high-affinity Fe2+/Pb2+ permease
MYTGLTHAHSGWRWIVLLLIISAILQALLQPGKKSKTPLFAFIATHIQLVFGVILYFLSPKVQFTADTMKVALTRFYTVEHTTLMLIAIVLITLGYGKWKRAETPEKASKKILTFYLIGLILILAGIPWPFRNLGAGWF